ncbi:MAG: MEDS domain-containing protein [Nitrososphaerales archaeon]
MVRSVIVPDVQEIQKLAEGIPSIVNGLEKGQKYTTVFSTGNRQLILVQDGNPILGYKVATSDPSISPKIGMQAIENFIDGFDQSGHLVMLYDEPKLARGIELRFAKIGLESGERCMYVISEDDIETLDSIRKQMDSFGIDTANYMRDERLKFVRINDPAKHPGGFKAGCMKILDSLLEQTKGPVRMVLHVRYLFNTKEEIDAHAEFEGFIGSNFSNFPGSMLCNHFIGRNTRELHADWTKRMLQTHDSAFIVSSNKGLPFVI